MPMALMLLLAGCRGDQEVEGLVGILLSPDPVIVPIGGNAQLVATGLLDERETIDMTALVSWEVDGAYVQVSDALDEEGLLDGISEGSASISAVYGDIESPWISVQVTDAQLERLSVDPDSVSAGVGDQIKLSATATFSDGATGDVSSQVRWITGDAGVAIIESDGQMSAVGEGSTSIEVKWDEVSAPSVSVSVSSGGGTPDISIASVSGEIAGGYLDLSVQLANTGAASATDFWVDVFVDPSGTPSSDDIGTDYSWVSYVGADSTTTLEFSIYTGSGSHSIWVLADTADDVDESNESNNSFSTTVSDGGSSGGNGPDLTISYFDYSTDETAIYYYIDVLNDGDETAEKFYVDLFLDESAAPTIPAYGDTWALLSSLGAGETLYADFVVYEWCHWCWSYAVVDSLDSVNESNESNNVAGYLDVYSE